MSRRTRTFENGLVIAMDVEMLCNETGGDVWTGALCLQRFLAANVHLVAGRRVLELGTGTGFLALSTTLLGASLSVATDRPQCLALPRRNASENSKLVRAQPGKFACCECDWDEVARTSLLPHELGTHLAGGPFDLIVASDVFYDQKEHVLAFAAVLRRVCTVVGTRLLLCQSFRPTTRPAPARVRSATSVRPATRVHPSAQHRGRLSGGGRARRLPVAPNLAGTPPRPPHARRMHSSAPTGQRLRRTSARPTARSCAAWTWPSSRWSACARPTPPQSQRTWPRQSPLPLSVPLASRREPR